MTLFTLAISLICMWALSFYTTTILRQDMERISGQQQFSTASMAANNVNREIKLRIDALKTVAATLTPQMLGNTPALQKYLEDRSVFQSLFNAGTFITGPDGTATASTPLSTQRQGINYMERDYVVAALKDGMASVGQPVLGKASKAPGFAIAVPIMDAQGKTIGTLIGVTDLSLPNFMDYVTESSYGKTGGFLIIARKPRLIVTATDKRRVMRKIGNSAMVNRYIGGYEGSDVFVNQLGVEVLSSVKSIPIANWYLAASLPITEAFEPMRDMRRRMILATILLSLLACGLTWWMLRRQLFPVLAAAEKLATMAVENVPLRPLSLPIPRHTEVGELIVGVNRVLKTLEVRETASKDSEIFRSAIIDSVFAEIAVLDRHGVITAVNQPWQRFAEENNVVPGVAASHTGVGTNYLEVCRKVAGTTAEDSARRVVLGVQAVLGRRLPLFTMEYRCDSPDEQRWFMMIVTPLELASGGAVVTHNNITGRKHAEIELFAAKAEAETANQSKSHFLAAVSHDLRQPLAALTLYVDLLNGVALGSNAQILPCIKDCVTNLGDLLSDLLDVSKLEAGVVVPVMSSFAMNEVLGALLSVHAAKAEDKGLSLRVHPTNVVIRTDRTLMLRLLGNLIANALEYTKSGGVLIACRQHAGKQWLEVYDTGIGIAEDKIGFIFEEFRQVENEARNAGSGLGLYIVAKSAELLGLQIRVCSRVGRGSLFAVELPTVDAIVTVDQTRAPHSDIKLRIGLVEDNVRVLRALTLTLEQLGHVVVAAGSGEEIIERLNGQAPDLIISDYRLAAGETGYDVIAHTKAVFGDALPALIITGDTDKNLVSSMSEKGIVVLYKPVQVDALRASIMHVTDKDIR
ncbi:MAG: ATP-binding protein [Undibacterium sp.]|nr:ATP-binding protein [Undibacterium sp.]